MAYARKTIPLVITVERSVGTVKYLIEYVCILLRECVSVCLHVYVHMCLYVCVRMNVCFHCYEGDVT